MGIIKNNPTINKPVNTRNTAVQVRGVQRCVKIQHCTRTCITRLGNTAALLVPVLHPSSNLKQQHCLRGHIFRRRKRYALYRNTLYSQTLYCVAYSSYYCIKRAILFASVHTIGHWFYAGDFRTPKSDTRWRAGLTCCQSCTSPDARESSNYFICVFHAHSPIANTDEFYRFFFSLSNMPLTQKHYVCCEPCQPDG